MSLAQAYAHCGEAARASDRDRWLGALYAPPAVRAHLHALIAFEGELDRLRETVRDPRAGEIRLVWWREALSHRRDDEARGHPVAAAMLDTLDKFRPAPHLIENAVAGRQFDLYDDPFATLTDLEAYLGETRSGLLQIAAVALGGGEEAAETSGLCGVALGLVGSMRDLARPRPLAFAPRDVLARHGATAEDFRARRALPSMASALRELVGFARRRAEEAERARAKLPPSLNPGYAGLATASLWLSAIERGIETLFDATPEVAAWRRQWALWRWARRA